MTTTQADANLLAMINRHAELWEEWDRRAKADEDDPRIPEISEDCSALEPLIIATPAHTEQGLAGKRRLLEVTQYAGREGRHESAIGEVAEQVEAILALDDERVKAAD
jgi:hypothetical protein